MLGVSFNKRFKNRQSALIIQRGTFSERHYVLGSTILKL